MQLARKTAQKWGISCNERCPVGVLVAVSISAKSGLDEARATGMAASLMMSSKERLKRHRCQLSMIDSDARTK
jgi:hypothetical protein